MTLTPLQFRQVGLALYGERWRTPLARLLGVNDRTMRHIDKAAQDGTDAYVDPRWLPEVKSALDGLPEWRRAQADHAAEALAALDGMEPRPIDITEDDRQRMAR